MSSGKNVEGKIRIDEDFAQLLAEHITDEKSEKQVVQGTIVKVENGYVMVDAGLKSEGRIAISQFALDGKLPGVHLGDTVDVYIERLEGHGGEVVLSYEKAVKDREWQIFAETYTEGMEVEGIVIGRVKGGFATRLTNHNGVIAFLPGSQVDLRPIKDITFLTNASQNFKILKIDRTQGNIVISRRAIIEEQRRGARDELLSQINEGTILEGVVKNITDYGAFIDLKHTDGLLHITDMSWSKILHPSEVLSVGQVLKVMVIKYNPESQRISLGLKQLTKNPWEDLQEKYAIGTKVMGTVSLIADYGAFVLLEPNVEGLVYLTEINWLARNVHPRKLLEVGDKVEAVVLDVDIAKHRISLSMKRCHSNPWEDFAEKYPIGTKIRVSVRSVADFGLFAVLEEDKDKEFAITLLVPVSELSWTENPDAILAKYSRGDVLDCVINTIDLGRSRISASVRQLVPDPMGPVVAELMEKSIVPAVVKNVYTETIEVELAKGLHAFIPKTELSNEIDAQVPANFPIGSVVDVKILSFDNTKRLFQVSIRACRETGEVDGGEVKKSKKGGELKDLDVSTEVCDEGNQA